MRTCSLTRGLTAIALLVGLAGGSPALAGNPAAPGSEVIWLLKDCLAAGHDVDLDCSQQVVDITERALQALVWVARRDSGYRSSPPRWK
jgi:hypothetical protein